MSAFGFVVIDKPQGITSHDCVHRLRKIFGIKRVGHGGTLDPAVTGVLPIALGNATRLLPYLPGEKTYQGVIQLGQRTSTDDIHGVSISNQAWPKLDKSCLERTLDNFRGSIQQRPPQISSVHVQGERAYKRSRRGEVLDLPTREVVIHELLLLNWNPKVGQLEIMIHCSSGTYIRALSRDLGEMLGCGGCLAQLRRTQALSFTEEQAVPLPEKGLNESTILPKILTPNAALNHLPHLQLKNEEEVNFWQTGHPITISSDRCKALSQAQPVKSKDEQCLIVILDQEEVVAGIATWQAPTTLQPKVVFNAKG